MKHLVVAATLLLTFALNVNTASARTPREWYPGYNGHYSKFEAKSFFEAADRYSH